MTRNYSSALIKPVIFSMALIFAIGLLSSAGPGLAAPAAQAAASPVPQEFGLIEYVVDLSASMMRPLPDGDTIWDKTLDSIFTYEDYMLGSNLALGLRTFGYPDLRCDQQLEPSSPVIAPRIGAGPDIVDSLGKILPNPSGESGRSAILTAISKALDDVSRLSAAAGDNRSIIVFTDGKENCMLNEQERQEWMDTYMAQIRLLTSTGIQVKTHVLIIVPEQENICTLFSSHEGAIVCIPVSAVEATNLPGIVEAIRVETVATPTAEPTIRPTETKAPTFTPTPTDYAFYEVPTGEALPTLDRTLIAQAGTPVVVPQGETSVMDPKVMIVPIILVVLIGLGLLIYFVMNMSGGIRRR